MDGEIVTRIYCTARRFLMGLQVCKEYRDTFPLYASKLNVSLAVTNIRELKEALESAKASCQK